VMAKNPFGGRPISLSTSWTWDVTFRVPVAGRPGSPRAA
jgi:hypothetical protein